MKVTKDIYTCFQRIFIILDCSITYQITSLFTIKVITAKGGFSYRVLWDFGWGTLLDDTSYFMSDGKDG